MMLGGRTNLERYRTGRKKVQGGDPRWKKKKETDNDWPVVGEQLSHYRGESGNLGTCLFQSGQVR